MRFVTLALIAILGTGIVPAEARVTQRDGQGRIVFAASSGDGGAFDIFSADLAGERVVNLTADPHPDRSPSWSPAGDRIVFASRRASNWDLYTMRADGSDLRRLTEHPAYDGEPAWSPDGRRIAFASMRDGQLDIYTLDLDSGNL